MKAIVTGSSRGLGSAVAEKFVKEGIDVAISSRDTSSLNAKLNELKTLNNKVDVIGFTVDFGDKESIKQYVKSVLLKWNRVDILVNNVGIYAEDNAEKDLEEELEKMINVNLFSSVRMNKDIIHQMKTQKSGVIINVISIAAKNLRNDAASYSISKMALKAYNDLLRESLRKHNIKVIALYPGSMDTSSWDGIDIDRKKLIQMSDMTTSIMNTLNLSKNTSIEEIIINTLND